MHPFRNELSQGRKAGEAREADCRFGLIASELFPSPIGLAMQGSAAGWKVVRSSRFECFLLILKDLVHHISILPILHLGFCRKGVPFVTCCAVACLKVSFFKLPYQLVALFKLRI